MFGLVAGLLVVVSSPVLVSPASADEPRCKGKPVWDPKVRRFVCQGGGRDPGRKEPRRQPREGQERTAEKLESGCGTAGTCIHESCDFEAGEKMMSVYERREVYHRGQGWTPAPPPAGNWKVTGYRCVKPGEQGPSAEQVWEAVKDIGVEGGKAEIQPPNGKSLVKFKTNFYTTKDAEEFPVHVGPVEVQIRATPVSYRWDFGDGHTKTTGTPGAEYPKLEVVHSYENTGTFHPSVTIFYTIEWRYGGQDWQQFDDPLEARNSPTTDLQIVESQSELGD